ANVKTPFSSLYDSVTYASSYFEPIYLLVRCALAMILVGAPSESTEQLVLAIVVQALFSIGAALSRPYVERKASMVLIGCQALVVTMLALRCGQVIEPLSEAIGVLMVVVGVLLIVCTVAGIIAMRLGNEQNA